MTGECLTCKFWDTTLWRSTAAACGLEGWNWCLLAENNYDDSTPYPDSPLKAEDCESHHSGLRTRFDFGCNQHKPLNTP